MGKKRRKTEELDAAPAEATYSAPASDIPAPGPRGSYDEGFDIPAPGPSRSYRGSRRSFASEQGPDNELPAPGPSSAPSSIPGPGPGPARRGRPTGRRRSEPMDSEGPDNFDAGYSRPNYQEPAPRGDDDYDASPPRLNRRPSNRGAANPDRGGAERGSSDRGGSERGSSERGSSERGSSERGSSERGGAERAGTERGDRGNTGRAERQERGGNDRGGSERGGNDRGGNDRSGRSSGFGRGLYEYESSSELDNPDYVGGDYADDGDIEGDNPYTNSPRSNGRTGNADQRGNYRGRQQQNPPNRQGSGRVPGPGPGQSGRQPNPRGGNPRHQQRAPGRPTMGGGRQQTRYNPGGRGPSANAPGPGSMQRGPRRPAGGRQSNYRGPYQAPRSNDPYLVDQDRFDDATVELHEEVGMLEMHPNGYGFLRKTANNYSRERTDPFVPGTMIERFGLREGMMIRGMIRPGRGQTGPRVKEIMDVDGLEPEACLDIKPFDSLTPINPEEWYRLEVGPKPLTNRIIDLLAPMGKGQRALIVAPPRSGKTILLQHISTGISTNYPDTKLIVLLVDERPEEVTDMRRNVVGEVVASSLDEEIESHVRLSQLVIERCKRLAEMGKDVFLLMDSITRLARAFNKWVGDSGRTMSGGVDIKAMDIPKKLFATARAFEEGGSVTIAGTALIDTDSRMDELIFQEFKGTGNMELVLDRKLAERRVWPSIDISKSGTRREELLLPERTLTAVTALRRTLTQMNPIEAMEQLTKQLGRFDSNAEFIHLISGKMTND
jgi:transcription termination factor Rho